jgi:hypothetical protein
VLALMALPASGEIVGPDEFEAMSLNRTLRFTLDGAPFGAEQFFEGRRTLWQYGDGSCVEGSWYAEGTALCFVYEGDALPYCWHLRRADGGHAAYLVIDGVEAASGIALSGIDTRPLDCPGPRVGS